jgi:predicted hydrolase (HD superfamily)
MSRFKIFWILLVFILFILPVQAFGEEKEYSPEEIIKLLHDLGYEYCKKEPSKDIFNNIV